MQAKPLADAKQEWDEWCATHDISQIPEEAIRIDIGRAEFGSYGEYMILKTASHLAHQVEDDSSNG